MSGDSYNSLVNRLDGMKRKYVHEELAECCEIPNELFRLWCDLVPYRIQLLSNDHVERSEVGVLDR